jgi:tetratricopeptide (TPR) repeat protein
MVDTMAPNIPGQELNHLNDTGRRMFADGDFKGAYLQFRKALILDPESDVTLNNLGITYWRTGNKEMAYQTLCKAMSINPLDRQIVINCGTVARVTGRVEEFSHLFFTGAACCYNNDIMGIYIDTILSEDRAQQTVRFSQRRQDQVVLVANKPISREAKLACGLKQAGFEVVLIYHEAPNFDAHRYCSKIIRYQTPGQALEITSKFNPKIFHVFATWNYTMPAMLIRNKPGKIVLDDYDVMAGMVKRGIARREYPGNLELERFCLENADGICCRGLEQQFAKRHMGYRYKGKILFLLDGCWSNTADAVNRFPKIDDGHVHFVYCGNISPKLTGPYNYHHYVALLLSRHKIHYHIYPYYAHYTPILKVMFHDYVIKNGGNPGYIHIHHPVPADDLIREISRYHYGLHLMWPNPMANMDDFPYELRGFDYGSTNKIFDYIDAGLPIFVHKGKLQKFLVERYGNGRAISDHSELLVKTVQGPPPVPAAYQMAPNIRRLVRFYEQL